MTANNFEIPWGMAISPDNFEKFPQYARVPYEY